MNRGKKPMMLITSSNNKMYMDLRDIIREHALPFLPAKALCRCNVVCRDWKLHISSPFFAHNQSLSFRGISGFFCQSPSGLLLFIPVDQLAHGVPDTSLSFLPEPVDVRCASNGLLCCQGRTGCKAYYICNPVTFQWKKLPKPSADHGCDPALVLVFEPSLLNFVAEYKLVCAFRSDLDGYEFEIYSSIEGSWRISREICFGERSILPSSGVYADGTVYWKADHGRILAFNLTSERTTLHYAHYSLLGQMNGKLCSASVHGYKLSVSRLSNVYTNTMSMDSRQEAWEVKHVADLHNLSISSFGFDSEAVLFIGDDMAVIRTGNSLNCYNMKTKEFKQLASEAHYNARLIPYVNSLVEM